MAVSVQAKDVATMFETAVKALPNLESKKIFGWTCVFVGGKMLGGFYKDQMILRLSEKDRVKFLELPGASHFNPKGNRPMLEYVDVPQDIITSTKDLKRWVDKGFGYVAGLPTKAKTPGRSRRMTANGSASSSHQKT